MITAIRLLATRPILSASRTVNIDCLGRYLSSATSPVLRQQLLKNELQAVTARFAPITVNVRYTTTLSQTTHQVPWYKEKDHRAAWAIERIQLLFTIGSISWAFVEPSQGAELLACLMLSTHTGWGLENVMVDYVRDGVVGVKIAKRVNFFAFLMCLAMMSGLGWQILFGKGVITNIKQLWFLEILESPYQPLSDE